MNQVLTLLHTARVASCTASDPRPGLYSEHMLAELLALHEEMIEQLRLERLGMFGNADFLTGMMAQHEKTAAMLRAKLEDPDADIAADGFSANESCATKIAGGRYGIKSARHKLTACG